MIPRRCTGSALFLLLLASAAPGFAKELRFSFEPGQAAPELADGSYAARENADAIQRLREIARDYGAQATGLLVWTYPIRDGLERGQQRVSAVMAALGLPGVPVLRPMEASTGNWVAAERRPVPVPALPRGGCGWWLEVDDPRIPSASDAANGDSPVLAVAAGGEISVPVAARFRLRGAEANADVVVGDRVIGAVGAWIAEGRRPLVVSVQLRPAEVAETRGVKSLPLPTVGSGAATRVQPCSVILHGG